VVVVETGGRPVVVGGDAAVWFGELDEPHTEGQLRVRALDPELVWLARGGRKTGGGPCLLARLPQRENADQIACDARNQTDQGLMVAVFRRSSGRGSAATSYFPRINGPG
jgi:hypothetical protein